jgi:TolB-like protein
MAIWTAEIKELEKLNEPISGRLPALEKEMGQLLKTGDENVAMLYSRRCLEIIVTDLCESELKRARKTEPLKGIIDKLHKEEKVPSYIITSMHSLNSLSTYGAHPKDFDPEQVKPALSNLAIVMKWYLRYRGIEIVITPSSPDEEAEKVDKGHLKDQAKLEKSIAVLPFINDSPDQENTYFINGVMEEILNNLQKIKDLRVISRTSAEIYRGHKKPIYEIAQELGVNYIVEGSGQKYGNSFRLRAQLIKAEHESHLWGKSFQSEINDVRDIFNIQIKTAESIANELRAVISPEEKKLIEKIPTKDITAYDTYFKGKFYLYKATLEDIDTALHYFEQAKERDPEFALAYSGIGMIWLFRQQLNLASPDEAGPKMMEAVGKALELDSTLADVHYTMAGVKVYGMYDLEGGESSFRKAIEINPNHAEAHALYSHLLNMLGRPEEAMEHIELALKLDPHNPTIKVWYSQDLLYARRYDEVISVSRKIFEKNPTMFMALEALYQALYLTGKYAEAIEAMKLHYCEFVKDYDHVFDQYEKLGFTGTLNLEAETLIEQLKTKVLLATALFDLYFFAGNKERAIDFLEQAYEMHDPNVLYVGRPTYTALFNEPRFKELCRKLKIYCKTE